MKPRKESQKFILDTLCPVPHPLNTEEERLQYHHLDLTTMTSDDLKKERVKINWRIVMDDHPHPWLLERRSKIEARLNGK
ncbi:hypothetical protein [Candidatus Nitrospira salsa]